MSEAPACQRMGIFGGTFDPIHIGHLLIAESVREQMSLQEVRFIPAAIAPHKIDRFAGADSKQRCEMVQLAISGNPHFTCDDRELRRGGVSYTVDTLTELNREFPDRELVLLMGADSLHEFHTWRDPQRICQLAFIAIVARGGEPLPDLKCLQPYMPHASLEELRQHVIHMPQLEISSTDIRRRIKANQSIRYLISPAVAAYIASQQLYDMNQSLRERDER